MKWSSRNRNWWSPANSSDLTWLHHSWWQLRIFSVSWQRFLLNIEPSILFASSLWTLYVVCIKQSTVNIYALIYTRVSHTHTRPFNGPFLGLPRWAGTRKVKTNLDFTEARDSEWQWHQLGHMQVCTSLQTDNHASTPALSFLQAGCPSCCPANSVKALKAGCHCMFI